MDGDLFYMTAYANFGDGGKATQRSPPGNLKWWIITQCKGFMRIGIEKVHRSVWAFVCLVLTS